MIQITREEFKKTVRRMMTEASGGKTFSNDNYCAWLNDCSKCPLGGRNAICLGNDKRVDNLFGTIQTVEKWAKEHPIVTYEQKYEEMFGVKPINDSGEYVCPSFLGLKPCNYEGGNGSPCAKCAKEFWQSKYKDPKKEG